MRKVHPLLIGLLALSSTLVVAVPQAQACNLFCIDGYHCCLVGRHVTCCPATPSSSPARGAAFSIPSPAEPEGSRPWLNRDFAKAPIQAAARCAPPLPRPSQR
jgi:hypothetical protein